MGVNDFIFFFILDSAENPFFFPEREKLDFSEGIFLLIKKIIEKIIKINF